MQYITIPVTAFAQNCSIIWCEQTKECAFVDPGGDANTLIAAVEQRGLKPVGIFLTHAHLDHVGATQTLAHHYTLKVSGPQEADKFWLDALPIQAQRFGLPHADAFLPERWLNEGDTLTMGHTNLSVIHTPGHTPGHVAFFNKDSQLLFAGDVLFSGSIGRTDFPGGNHQQLINSIKSKLLPLGDDVTVVPGHGPNTTLGQEKRYNPYLA